MEIQKGGVGGEKKFTLDLAKGVQGKERGLTCPWGTHLDPPSNCKKGKRSE